MDYPAPCMVTKMAPELPIIKSDTYKIQSAQKKEYIILVENKGTLLNISTESRDEKTLKKKSFKNKFSLIDIKKVKLFLSYDSIEECLSEIDFLKGSIKEENNQLNLKIPLNSKKYPEIAFPLLEKEISDSEKIQELYDIIQNLNNKVQNLEMKLDNLTFHQIKIIAKKEEPRGISIDAFTFGKEDFYKYIDKNVDLKKNYYFKIFVNIKDVDKINETKKFFIENKFEIQEIKGTKIELDFIEPNKTFIVNDEGIEFINSLFGIKEMKNISLLFKTDLEVEDIFEKEATFSILYDKLMESQFILKGITINFKLNLLNLIDFAIVDNSFNYKLNFLLLGLKFILSWKDSFLPDSKTFLNYLKKEINGLFEENELEKLVKFLQIGDLFIKGFFRRFKSIQLLENIILEEITIVMPIIELEIGFFLKLKSKTFEQYFKKNIINMEK